jgi:hypothetical protein
VQASVSTQFTLMKDSIEKHQNNPVGLDPMGYVRDTNTLANQDRAENVLNTIRRTLQRSAVPVVSWHSSPNAHSKF